MSTCHIPIYSAYESCDCSRNPKLLIFFIVYVVLSRSRWPYGLRSGSAVARLLGLWVWISPGAWNPVSCACCVLSGTGLCIGLITHPQESYRVWFVWVSSWSLDNEEALAQWGLLRHGNKHMLCWRIICYFNEGISCLITHNIYG